MREIWARTLADRGTVGPEQADALLKKHASTLQAALDGLRPEQDYIEPQPEAPPPGAASKAETAVPLDRLRELNTSLLTLPSDFTIHRKLERVREKRINALNNADERTIDWAAAEDLALASILADGISIRLTGEDVERGTFSHRHAVFHDVTLRQGARAAADAAAGARRVRDAQQPADRERGGRDSSTATTSRNLRAW